ncbi:MAG: hypothetical protein IGS39_03905 [Calothrix sp. C42_A2020_038]|nr:hypothetical protein [Calothrix sp. C42_A2020_038]
MNIQELRQSLKQKWLCYYQENCHWLDKMQIWGEFEGERRPLSSFVLATVSILEPNLVDILPLLVDLNTNPDDMIAALGLNFNPQKQLHHIDTVNEVNKIEDRQPDTTYNHKNQRVVHITTHHLQHQSQGASNTVAPQKSNDIQVAVSTSYLNQIKTVQPLQSVTVVTPTSKRDISVSAVTTAPPISSNYKLTTSKIKQVETTDSSIKRRKLANWVDEFCQGRDWDRDESIYIPF